MIGTVEEMTLAVNRFRVGMEQQRQLPAEQIVLQNVLKLQIVLPLTIPILEMAIVGGNILIKRAVIDRFLIGKLAILYIA